MIDVPGDDRTRQELAAALEDLAALARDVVPGCAAASVTVLHDGTPGTVASTDHGARGVDEEQYGQGCGPCLDAMRGRDAITVEDYRDERRWPPIAAASLRMGLRSSLSMPLQQDGRVLGALNMYGETPAEFGPASRASAATFARQAALVLGYLSRLHTERALHAREHGSPPPCSARCCPPCPTSPGSPPPPGTS